MPVTCQTEPKMLHQKRSLDVHSVSKQDGVAAQKRPRSFYSSNIKTWASRHSDNGGIQAGIGNCDVVRGSSKQVGGDGLHNVNGFSSVINCETVSDQSSTCAEKCPSISTEGVTDCDVVICDSDDDLSDSPSVKCPQKTRKANSNTHSESAKYRAKGHNQKALPSRAKVTSKTSAVKRQSLDPVDLILEVESDDDDCDVGVSDVGVSDDGVSDDGVSDDGVSDDGEVTSFIDVAPSKGTLKNNVDISSRQPTTSRSSQVRSPVIEIDSDSCSSVKDSAPLHTKSWSSVKDSAPLQTKSWSSVRDSAPLHTKSWSSVKESAPSQNKSWSSVRERASSKTKSCSTARGRPPSKTKSCSTARGRPPSKTKSCSTARGRPPSKTKSCSTVVERAPLKTKSGSTVEERTPSKTKSYSTVGECAPSQTKSCSSFRERVPSEANALQNHSASLNIETEHFNNTTTLKLPTSSQGNPHAGDGFISLPKVHAPPMQQYSNYLGAFKSYCGNDSTSGISRLSNGGAQSGPSDVRHANGAIGADSLSQEQLLAFVKSGKFSLQYVAGIPVLCPINVPPSNFLPNFLAAPFGASTGPRPNTIGSIYSPSLQTNSIGYGTERGVIPGSISTNIPANAFGHVARRMTLASMNGKLLSGSQLSSTVVRTGGQTMTEANVDKTVMNKANIDVAIRDKIKITLNRKRAKKCIDSPSRKAKVQASMVDLGTDKDKDLGNKTTNGENNQTDMDSKNRPKKDTVETAKRDGERPMAKALMGLAMQLVSKQVITELIKVTKKTLEKRPEEERIQRKLENRDAELKRETEAFELKTKICNCRRFKTESSNVAIEHLRHGSSSMIYQCCFCLSTTKAYRTFRQHMERVHKIVNCQKHDSGKSISCPFCPYDTMYRPLFEAHSRRCLNLLQTEKNLHPRLDDFDIPISYQEKKRRNLAREVSLVASIGSKIDQHGQRHLGAYCRICAKFYSDSFALRRHNNKAHKMPDLRTDGTPLKQNKTPICRIPAKKSGSTPLKLTTPSSHEISDPNSDDTPLKQKTPSKTASKLSTGVGSPQKNIKDVKCCFCEELLGREMVQHFRVQHHISLNTMVKKHFCYFCDCALQNVEDFEKHMINTHANVFPDAKSLWLRISATVRLRERDTFTEFDTSETDGSTTGRPWKCLKCSERFHSSSSCYRHAMLFHEARKVECQLCPKMIATGAAYTQHLQQCHIRKCHVVIERLSLPFVTNAPTPKTKPVQLLCLGNCDSKIDVELSDDVSAAMIKSPSITSCDQDFPIVDERDIGLEPVTVCI